MADITAMVEDGITDEEALMVDIITYIEAVDIIEVMMEDGITDIEAVDITEAVTEDGITEEEADGITVPGHLQFFHLQIKT